MGRQTQPGDVVIKANAATDATKAEILQGVVRANQQRRMDKSEREIAIARLDRLARSEREHGDEVDEELFIATVLKALMDDLHRRQTREES